MTEEFKPHFQSFQHEWNYYAKILADLEEKIEFYVIRRDKIKSHMKELLKRKSQEND